MNYLARFLTVFFILVFITLGALPVFAQEPQEGLQFKEVVSIGDDGFVDLTCTCYADALDISRDGESYLNKIKLENELQNAMSCEATAGNVNAESWLQHALKSQAYALANSISSACETNDPEKKLSYFNRSAIGTTNAVIAGLFTNPPASSTYYIADLMQHAGFVEPAYAQGIGYSGLFPLIGLWRLFRNLAYILLIVVAIVIGFMIMFRMNIDAQTVIAVQSALPGIAVTLILVTFSYAIAGLLIDLMYFVMFLVVALFGQAQGILPSDIGATQEVLINSNLWTLWQNIINGKNVFSLPAELLKIFLPVSGAAGAGVLLWGAVSALPSSLVVGGIIAAIPLLIITIALFFAFLRIMMLLISSYIQIIINVIFAPLILLPGAIPGNSAFTGWLRALVGNLSVYPVTAAIFLLTSAIAKSVEDSTELWGPPFLFGPTVNKDLLVGLIGLGMMLLAPTFILQVKSAIAQKQGMPISPGVIVSPTAGLMTKGLGMFAMYQQIGGGGLIKGLKEKIIHPGGAPPGKTT